MTENFPKGPVGLLYTGGTIGCAGAPLTPLPAERFREGLSRAGLLAGHDVAMEALEPALDSTGMRPADWVRLAGAVLAMAKRCRAVVVLHGTDTLAWSASALALLTTLVDDAGQPVGRLSVPVILTGSQRPLLGAQGVAEGTDAGSNLAAALAAANGGAHGVRIAFGGRVMPGARAMKVSAQADAAFACPNGSAPLDPLPAASPEALTVQADGLAPLLRETAVLPVPASPLPPGMLAETLAAAIAALGDRPAALHLMGYGTGNMPEGDRLAPLLRAAAARGVLIAAGTQVPHGHAQPSAYAVGDWLAGCGAWPTADRTPAAEQAKLAVLASLARLHGWDRETARVAHARCHAGEGAA